MAYSVKISFGGITKTVTDNNIRGIEIQRGKSSELQSFDAATVTITFSNQNRQFEPNGSFEFSAVVQPAGTVVISKESIVIFTGYISDWNFTYDLNGDSIAQATATDALWVLNNLALKDYTANETAPLDRSDQRLNIVLNRPEVGWSTSLRKIGPSANPLLNASIGSAILSGGIVASGTNVLEYMRQVEASESGRLFVDKEGRIVFKTRTDTVFYNLNAYQRTNLCTNPTFYDATVGTLGWTASAGAIARSTSDYYVGSGCGSITSTPIVYINFNTPANTSYTLSAYVKPQSGSANITIKGFGVYSTTVDLLNSSSITSTASNRTNLIPNPSFENNTTSWFAANSATIAQSTAYAYSGIDSLLVTYPTQAAGNITGAGINITLAAATTYTYSAWVYVPTGSVQPQLSVQGAGFTSVTSSAGTSNDVWQRLSVTFTTTAAQSYALYVLNNAATTAGQTFYLDAVLLETGSATLDYFDGSFNRDATTRYEWSGTAHASTSIARVWDRISTTIQLDPIYTSGRLQIESSANAFIDGILIEQDPNLGEYFDGSDKPADTATVAYTYAGATGWNP